MNLPETFKDKMKELLRGEYETYIESFSEQNQSGLRVNTLKISPEEFEKISPFSLKRVPWTSNGYYYENGVQPAKHPYYFAGLYYLQEPSAMTPASLLPIKPGDKVLDLCAAPGGKTTELGAKLKGEGVLISNDVSASRAKALLKNVELFGLKNAVVTNETPNKLRERFMGYFDKILIDAPCSGEGMFRKDPSIIKNWEKMGTAHYAQLQRQIVTETAPMLKPGGLLLYSTCTFSPEENEQTIEYLLEQCPELSLIELPMIEGFDCGHPEWSLHQSEELHKCRRLWPHRIQGEGHFLALLQKSPDSEQEPYQAHQYQNAKRTEELDEFLNRISWNIDRNRIEIHNDHVFYLPEDLADIKGLRILRSGLYLGQCKKKRFEPSQSLAVALAKGQFDNEIEIDLTMAVRYLKCETIPVTGDNGMALICADQHPLGWGKNTNGTLKNKYHSGWRWM